MYDFIDALTTRHPPLLLRLATRPCSYDPPPPPPPPLFRPAPRRCSYDSPPAAVLTTHCQERLNKLQLKHYTPGTVTRSNSGRTDRTNNRGPRALFPDRSYVVIENRTACGKPHLSMSSPFSAVYSSNSNLSQIDLL